MDAVLRNELEVQKLATLFVVPVAPKVDDEQTLWSAFKAGSRDALNSIFIKYSRLLYSYGRNITADRALIADCIQDIFVELWVRKEKLSDVNSIRFYLMSALRRSIVRRLSTDKRLLGNKGVNEHTEENEVEFSIEFTLIHDQLSRELRLQLQSAMAQLSKRQQEAIYLKFYENMSYEELSSVMDINVKAAYNLIGKAIILLRSVVKRSAA